MPIHHRNDALPFETKDTSLIREIVHPAHTTAQNQSLAEATVAPGATTQAHFHARSEEIYFVLSGEAIFRMENQSGMDQSTLIAGAAVVIAPGCKHQIRNSGTEELVFLCCCAPPYSHEDTHLCESLFQSDTA